MSAGRTRARGDRVVAAPKPRSDAYVGLLGLSLLALSVAMVFGILNWSSYPESKPPAIPSGPRSAGPAPTGPVAPPAQPVQPQAGQPAPAQIQPAQPPAGQPAPPQPAPKQ